MKRNPSCETQAVVVVVVAGSDVVAVVFVVVEHQTSSLHSSRGLPGKEGRLIQNSIFIDFKRLRLEVEQAWALKLGPKSWAHDKHWKSPTQFLKSLVKRTTLA